MSRKLQVLELSGNRLRSLPCEIGWLAGLKQLSVADNSELHIPLHVLQLGFRYVCGNCFLACAVPHVLPACMHTLTTQSLAVHHNHHSCSWCIDTIAPASSVLRCRAVMSYLQVVGEQHHQVESHMAAFTSRLTDLRSRHNLLLPGTVEVCEECRMAGIGSTIAHAMPQC